MFYVYIYTYIYIYDYDYICICIHFGICVITKKSVWEMMTSMLYLLQNAHHAQHVQRNKAAPDFWYQIQIWMTDLVTCVYKLAISDGSDR